MVSSKDFWDKRAEGYSKQPIADQEAYEKKLEMTRKHLTPETRLMEIGCGTGSTAIIHASSVKEIYATDISPNMIEIAKEKAKKENITNITFESLSIEDMKIDDGSFDIVLALNILHLVGDVKGVIEEIYRYLKPGGVFISSTACFDGILNGIARILMPLAQLVNLAPTASVFSTEDLERYIQASGFLVDSIWKPKRSAAVFVIALKQ